MRALRERYNELKRNNPEKLILFLALSYLLVLFFLFGTITFWLIDKFEANSQENISLITNQALEIKKEQLITKTKTTISLSQTILQKKESDIKEYTKVRVENVYSMISQIYDENRNKNKDEIIDEIKNLLKSIQTYDSSYTFLSHSNGFIILHPDKNIEGLQITDKYKDEYNVMQKALAIKDSEGAGYFIASYYKPKTKILEEKIYYLRYFKPLDLLIINGQYRDEIELKAKEELLSILKNQQKNTVNIYLNVFEPSSDGLKSIDVDRYALKEDLAKDVDKLIKNIVEKNIKNSNLSGYFRTTTDKGINLATYYSSIYENGLIISNTVVLNPILQGIRDEISSEDSKLSSEIIEILNMFVIFLFITAILSITIIKTTKEIFSNKNSELKKKNDSLNLIKEELEQSERKHKTIIETSPYPIFILSSNTISFTNSALCSLLKLKRDELIGKEIDMFLDSSDVESFFQSLEKTHQKREIKLIDKEKNTIYAKLHIADIEYINDNDKLIIVNDITELKKQEDRLKAKNQELEHLNEELKNTNEELMRIFDNSTNPIALINKDGFLSYANEAFYKISGYLDSDIPNLNIMKLIRKEFKKQFFAKLEKADAIGFAEEFSAIIFSSSANSIHTKISLTKFSKDSFVMMLRDITAELMHTQNLEKMIKEEIEKTTESELKFATLFDNAPAGILILDENHCIVRTNKAFESITGYKKDRLEGRKIEEFFLDEYKEQIVNTLKQSSSEHDARASYEWKLVDNIGHTKDINALLEVIERKDESFRLMIVTDITELKKAREKEKQQEKLLIQQSRFAVMGEMINMIAHQWRQPLGALSIEIINLVDHLENEPSDSDYLKKWEKKSTSILKHLSHTIDEFRTFFKQDKKKEIFNLTESIENSIDLIVATLRFRNIEIVKEFDSDIEIFGFQNKLQQAFLNILNNAKDAILENELEDGKIVILVKREENMAHISFEDNAGGIKVIPITRIFEPYFSTKSKNSSGIGLYMTKVIIDSHMGGELKVSNSKIGAKFDIYLPIFKDEGEHDS